MVGEWECECPACPSAHKTPITREAEGADVAIVVDFPTSIDGAKDRLLTGDAGGLARIALKNAGVDLDNCYVTTALNCRPNTKKTPMMNKAMVSCRERLIEELKWVRPRKILCLGPVGFSAITSDDRVAPITKVRGRWVEHYGWRVMATFNPTMVMGEPGFFRDFARDLQKFAMTEGAGPLPRIEVIVPERVAEMREAFDMMSDAGLVSVDTETTGFSPVKDDLLAVGLGVLYKDSIDGISVVLNEALLSRKATWREVSRLLASEQATVFHNAKFDLKWLMRELSKRGFTYAPRNIQDTMLLNYCLDERPMGRFAAHSLKNMARVRCDAPDYDIHMAQWLKQLEVADKYTRGVLIEDMWKYLALDCYYTARMYPQLLNEVVTEGEDLHSLYADLLMPGTLALAEIETHGAMIDRAFFERTWEDLQDRAAPVLEEVREAIGIDDFNPNSPKQVSEYVYDTLGLPVLQTARKGKQQEGKTSKQVLKMLKKRYPEHVETIDLILEYRNLTKSAGTYIKGVLDRVDNDDRIRCDFLPHGTATGRLSSANPNLQNIPEASHTKIEIRNGYIAPEGYLLGNADYSQLELRMAAHLSQDDEFIAVYTEERDLHQEVAFEFFQKPVEEVTKYERYMAKCMNFGVVYGRGAHSLAFGPEMDYIEDELGGQRWSMGEVEGFFDKFFGKFPQFKKWMDEQFARGYTDQVVVSPTGRRRRFPFIPRGDAGGVGRQAVNTPVQGTASDFTFSALIRIHQRFKDLNAREGVEVAAITITVHDSIMFEFLPEHYTEIAAIVHEEMEEHCPFASRVPFRADVEVAPSWGQMGKYEFEVFTVDDT